MIKKEKRERKRFMYRFFVEPSQVGAEEIVITGADVNHIKNVLRMRIGEEIAISDGQEREYYCIIDKLEENQVIAHIKEMAEESKELPVKITLFQGIPKSDKLELIVQKAVELGACEIVPVAMKRSVAKIEPKKAEKKVERLNAIALSAAKQAKRSMIPEVLMPMSWKEAVQYGKTMDKCLVPYEDERGIAHGRALVKSLHGTKNIGVFIGPEGGFDEREIEEAKEAGFEIMTLGKRILRTETAGLAILSILMFELEEE